MPPDNPKKKDKPASGAGDAKAAVIHKSFLRHVREWADALVIAFVLAMFIRTFVAELYKIPTGSMIPTLLGGPVAEWDVNGDGRDDIVAIYGNTYPPFAAFMKEADGGFSLPVDMQRSPENIALINQHGKVENHLVLVNKFSYLFSMPSRGEIVIFKVPEEIYDRARPIYIKRLVGLPGEKIGIRGDNRLWIDDNRVDAPAVFERIFYTQTLQHRVFSETIIPNGEFFVFGDNSRNSADSREWGGVPLDNLRGRAVLRPWPIWKFKFF